MEFNEMSACFKRCFAQYDDADFSPHNEANWIYAVAIPEKAKEDEALKGFHYELVASGSGAGKEYHVELHFELCRHQYDELREALIAKFAEPKNRRKILATSYYSSLMWRVRTPVFDRQDIAEDVELLKTAVQEALDETRPKTLDSNGDAVHDKSEGELVLPCSLSIATVARMLREGSEATRDHAKNVLTIPPIQRGKVWNAARIETLWDSMFRGFPIGALSVWHNENKPRVYELLDGQQRATAIALGFDEFPDGRSKFNSILWIDLAACVEDGGCQYEFFVTTASQPWGYAESSSETRNSLLPASEKRAAAEALAEWEENQIKPYPFQLYPVKAKCPVPYTLLRQFAETTRTGSFDDFRRLLKPKVNKRLFDETLLKFSPSEEMFRELCDKVSCLSNDYAVFLLDASSVTENDIALYFTRIGKGGVVPGDEELAYSVLKSKLPSGFRTVVQGVHEEYGLASESRIAHLAIRLFKSEFKRDSSPQFYSGSPFSAVMEMCRKANASEKEAFVQFLNVFEERIRKVEGKHLLTQWHCARYASERNGDAFLMLLLAAGHNGLFGTCNVNGLAELLFGYASHIDYAVRMILEQGLQIAIANLTKERYYGKPRLLLPIAPEKLDGIPVDSIESLLRWKDDHPDVAQSIAEGYRNSNYDHAYNILVYACKGSGLNNQFKYDPNLGLWSEENLPWDYDHVMPHSSIEKMWDYDHVMPHGSIEKMQDSDAKRACEWLKNSMGNLAPLPFSVNRKWGDDARDENYPCRYDDSKSQAERARCQAELCIEDGASVASMWDPDGQISPLKFCAATIERYRLIYKRWYDGLGLGEILNFRRALEDTATHQSEIWDAAKHRYASFSKVLSMLPDKNFKHRRIVADDKEQKIDGDERFLEFCADQVITLSKDVNGVSVALSKCGIRGAWEIGLRKCSEDSTTTRSTYEKVKAKLPFVASSGITIEADKLRKVGERWWYWYDKPQEQMDGLEVKQLSERLAALLEFAEGLSDGNE